MARQQANSAPSWVQVGNTWELYVNGVRVAFIDADGNMTIKGAYQNEFL